MGNRYNVDPIRKRKLLMHRREINKLIGYTKQKGYTLVPLALYITDKGLIKLEIGVAKGKKDMTNGTPSPRRTRIAEFNGR